MIAVVEDIAGRVSGLLARQERLNEADTRRVLIDPVLRAVGWDLDGLDDVRTEYPINGNRVDYGLFVEGRPALFIEAKQFNQALDDIRSISQAVNYANTKGVEWCVLTNGREWRLYRVHAPVPAADKLFRRIDLAATPCRSSAEFLGLLSKEGASKGEITRAWERDVDDGHVRAALAQGIPSGAKDVLQAIAARCPGMSSIQVQDSIARMIGLNLPLEPQIESVGPDFPGLESYPEASVAESGIEDGGGDQSELEDDPREQDVCSQQDVVAAFERLLGERLWRKDGCKGLFKAGRDFGILFVKASVKHGRGNYAVKVRPIHFFYDWFAIWRPDASKGWLIPMNVMTEYFHQIVGLDLDHPDKFLNFEGKSFSATTRHQDGRDFLATNHSRYLPLDITVYRADFSLAPSSALPEAA